MHDDFYKSFISREKVDSGPQEDTYEVYELCKSIFNGDIVNNCPHEDKHKVCSSCKSFRNRCC